MLVDITNGKVYIDDELTLSPEYTFEEFKKTSYFNGQDGILEIYIGKKYIDNREYHVSFSFQNNKLYLISLQIADYKQYEIIYKDPFGPKEKIICDNILNKYGLDTENQYDWGRITSSYDPKGGGSSIYIAYPQNRKR